MSLPLIVLIVVVFLSLPLHLAFGMLVFKQCHRFVEKFFRLESFGDLRECCGAKLPALFLLGLLVHLWSAFILRCLGVPWALAFGVPFAALLWNQEYVVASVRSFRPVFTINSSLWFLVVFGLGISLFNATDKISTPWINNYGDLTYHVGMITSFVFGDNIPPEYHIFPGERLSYPFLMNFWTALFWWVDPSFSALSLLFLYQWCVAWVIVYLALNGNRWKVLPWLVLFGGGTYDYLFGAIASGDTLFAGEPAHSFISKGQPWAPFLSTIWVTQRPTILGVAVVLSALGMFEKYLAGKSVREGRNSLLLCTLLLGLCPLVHTHFFLVSGLYVGGVLVVRLLERLWRWFRSEGEEHLKAVRSACSDILLCAVPATALGCFALPWLLGKRGIIKLVPGWMPWPSVPQEEIFASLVNTIGMWLNNAPLWLLVLLSLFVLFQRYVSGWILVILFVAANVVQMAEWSWDQLKIFLAIYLVSLSVLASLSSARKMVFQAMLLLMIIPGVFETLKVLVNYQEHTVYSKKDIIRAETLRKVTKPHAVILGDAAHNSLVTLSGRRLFYGYEGTLASHGLDYQKRKKSFEDFDSAVGCLAEKRARQRVVCPQYLLWTEQERKRWLKKRPEDFPQLRLVAGDYIYEIRQLRAANASMVKEGYDATRFYAHRGLSHFAPENTKLAVALARERGFKKVEIDVLITEDGVPVVFHDASLKRVFGKNKKVCVTPYAELRGMTLLPFFLHGKFGFSKKTISALSKIGDPWLEQLSAERVVSLEEMFREFGDEIEWHLDIKQLGCTKDRKEGLKAIHRVVSFLPDTSKAHIESKNFSLLRESKSIDPKVPVIFWNESIFKSSLKEIRRIREAGVEGVDFYYLNYESQGKSNLDGFQLHTYTVNPSEEIARLYDKVDFIITDRDLFADRELDKYGFFNSKATLVRIYRKGSAQCRNSSRGEYVLVSREGSSCLLVKRELVRFFDDLALSKD